MEIHKANLEAQNTTRAILRPSATTIIPMNPQVQLNTAAAIAGQNQSNPLMFSTANVSSQNYAAAITNSILSQQQGIFTQSSQISTPAAVAGLVRSPSMPSVSQSQPSLQLTAATNSCYSSNGSLMSTSGSAVTPNHVQQIAVSNSLPMGYIVSKPTAAAAVAAAQAAAVAQAQAAQLAVNSSVTLVNNPNNVSAVAPSGVLAFPTHNNQLYTLAAQQAAAVQNGTETNAGNNLGNFLQQDLHSVSNLASPAAVAAAAQANGLNQSAIAAAQAAAAVAARTNTIPPTVSSPAIASYHVTPKLKSPAGMLTITSGRGSDKFAPY